MARPAASVGRRTAVGLGAPATGLRREELADLAGVSTDYVVRLAYVDDTPPNFCPNAKSSVA